MMNECDDDCDVSDGGMPSVNDVDVDDDDEVSGRVHNTHC